ncbi:MAG: permease-like cell division protein FtsX [Patescibacteria group bacterium]
MLSLYRIIKFSFQDIVRNVWLTIATVIILLLSLFSINTLMTVRLISDSAVNAIKEKIDISLYLKAEATDSEILTLKDRIATSPKIKEVVYISKQTAINSFRLKYANNPEVLAALKELGRNPLSPSLTVIPKNFDESSLIINELKLLDSPIIESRDFSDNSAILRKVNDITKRVNEIGFFIISIFILISLLVVYNAIRVTVYTHRQEIEIMRLVGASNRFIYMPYIVSAFIYTLFSILIIISVFFPFLSLLQPYLETFFVDYNINILAYFIDNFWSVFGAQFLIVFFINAVASFLAVRRYARV